MTKQDFSTGAANAIEAFGTTAHSAIDAWRAGGERLGDFAAARWDSAFRNARPQLSAQTRRNALNARKVFARWYGRGLALSTRGAETAVDTVVQTAAAAVARVARA